MALDFHRLDTREHLFGLESHQYALLDVDIFTTFTHWTGLVIDEYGSCLLSVENQQVLIRIIDEYVEKTNLNNDKNKTKEILALRGLLLYFANNNCDIQLLGD